MLIVFILSMIVFCLVMIAIILRQYYQELKKINKEIDLLITAASVEAIVDSILLKRINKNELKFKRRK